MGIFDRFKKKSKRGRPKGTGKLNNEKMQEIVEWIEKGNTNEQAARLSNVSESAFYEWRKKGEEDKVAGIKSIYVDFMESLIVAEDKFRAWNIANIMNLSQKDWRASLALLERKFPNEWGRRQQIDLKGDVEYKIIPPKKPEYLRKDEEKND